MVFTHGSLENPQTTWWSQMDVLEGQVETYVYFREKNTKYLKKIRYKNTVAIKTKIEVETQISRLKEIKDRDRDRDRDRERLDGY